MSSGKRAKLREQAAKLSALAADESCTKEERAAFKKKAQEVLNRLRSLDTTPPPTGTKVTYIDVDDGPTTGVVSGDACPTEGHVYIDLDDGTIVMRQFSQLTWEGQDDGEVEEPTHLGSHVQMDDAKTHYIVRTPVIVMGVVIDWDERDITDFVMDLKSRIQLHGDNADIWFEVEINDDSHKIPATVLSSLPKWRTWCNTRKLGWQGRDADLIGIFDMLKSCEGPTLHGVDVVGMQDGDTFVLPDEVIGLQGVYSYVPPKAGDVWAGRVNLHQDPKWDAHAIELLARLHRSDVTTPLLGWIAAAPLRSTVKKFPPLIVSGGSGYGKTTLLETILGVLGFWTDGAISLMSGTTPYIVSAYCASSNGLAIWFDEYRSSTFGRDDTRLAIQQAIRDSYDGSSTEKGGGGSDHMGVVKMPSCAPLIVSGESSFTEVSQLERALVINVPKEGRDKDVLAELQATRDDGFPLVWAQGIGRAYIEWLLEMRANPDYRHMVAVPQVLDRTTLGRSVARWGYGLLCMFMERSLGPEIDMPPYDGDTVASDQATALGANPIAEALEEGRGVIEFSTGWPMVWDESDYTLCRVDALVNWIGKERKGIQLPGGGKDVRAWLRTEYSAKEHNHKVYRRTWRWETIKTPPNEK